MQTDSNSLSPTLQDFLPCSSILFRSFLCRNLGIFLNLKGDKSMKKLAMAVALMCVLSTSILAGNMPTVGVADPPPPPTTTTATTTTTTETTTTTTTSSTPSTLFAYVILTMLGLR
jgi:hypothetical protein